MPALPAGQARDMTKHEPRSFSEVTFIEAAARRLPAVLVISPVRPGGERRLMSRFLGMAGAGRLALAPPENAKGEKVFLPMGWQVGLSFELGDIWFQATTTVLEHSMFAQFPTKRVDAVVVAQPRKVLSTNRRQAPRHRADPAKPFSATIWPGAYAGNDQLQPLQAGKLYDWSREGLGVVLARPLELESGERAVIRMERARTDECIVVWATLRHCNTLEDTDQWLAGFCDVAPVGPGEAVELMAFMAASWDSA